MYVPDNIAQAYRGARSLGQKPVDDYCQLCNHQGNYIHLRYEYSDEEPVNDAWYVVQKPNNGEIGGEIVAEGPMTVNPDTDYTYIHVDLGDHSGPVEAFFIDDPDADKPFVEPAPMEDEGTWIINAAKKTAKHIGDAASWTGGVLAGDFNAEMTTAQIITNTGITMIPVIDQVADLRDLIANAKLLIWDKRYNEVMVWVGVFACLIGLIPTLGSLAKGVIRLVMANAKLAQILAVMNRLARLSGSQFNGYRWLKKLSSELQGASSAIKQKFNDFLTSVASQIKKLSALAPTQVKEILESIEKVRGIASTKLDEAQQLISNRLHKILRVNTTHPFSVSNRGKLNVRRNERAISELGPHLQWQTRMTRKEFKEVEPSAVEITSEIKRKLLDMKNPKVIQQKFDAIKNDIPESWLEWSPETWNTRALKNFDGAPQVLRLMPNDKRKIYRVIDNESGVDGCWWSFEKPPELEAEWRTDMAVRHDFNTGGSFIEVEIPPPEFMLIGKAGPQRSIYDDNKALLGGGEQIYIPQMKFPEPAIPNVSERVLDTGGYYYTPWTAPAKAVKPIRGGSKIDECDM
ncbi:MAG: hypothetical protein OFPII_29920 [Osedax symbiont Rs1]|nr:MAG: hypothetical protein OFPII_29920 [Osedax symbiont Rs1]